MWDVRGFYAIPKKGIYQNVLSTRTISEIIQMVRSILGSRRFFNLWIRADDLGFKFLEIGCVCLTPSVTIQGYGLVRYVQLFALMLSYGWANNH